MRCRLYTAPRMQCVTFCGAGECTIHIGCVALASPCACCIVTSPCGGGHFRFTLGAACDDESLRFAMPHKGLHLRFTLGASRAVFPVRAASHWAWPRRSPSDGGGVSLGGVAPGGTALFPAAPAAASAGGSVSAAHRALNARLGRYYLCRTTAHCGRSSYIYMSLLRRPALGAGRGGAGRGGERRHPAPPSGPEP